MSILSIEASMVEWYNSSLPVPNQFGWWMRPAFDSRLMHFFFGFFFSLLVSSLFFFPVRWSRNHHFSSSEMKINGCIASFLAVIVCTRLGLRHRQSRRNFIRFVRERRPWLIMSKGTRGTISRGWNFWDSSRLSTFCDAKPRTAWFSSPSNPYPYPPCIFSYRHGQGRSKEGKEVKEKVGG